jgi:hypothetical protein
MQITREGTKCWIINKHSSSFELLLIHLKLLKDQKEISNEILIDYLEELKAEGIYNPRYGKLNTNTFKNKINELAFYMFGYKHRDNFFLSPLAYLLLKNINNELNVKYIFLSMLWGFQFSHPENRTEVDFKIFPFRLFYNLLFEKKLNYYLETIEVLYFLYFIKQIQESDFDELVDSILEFRHLGNLEKIEKLSICKVGRQNIVNQEDSWIANEIFWANKIHEWDYYCSKFLSESGVLKIIEGPLIKKFRHFTSSAQTETYRNLKSNKYQIPSELVEFTMELQSSYPYYSVPLVSDILSEIEFKTIVYSFLPNILLSKINEEGFEYSLFQKISEDETINIDFEDLVNSSIDSERFNDFEDYLKHSFNIFSDVKASKISGPGKTDIECLYIPLNEKFNVEAKTRKNQLDSIHVQRLRKHRVLNGSIYTLILTSKYSIGALRDIENTDNILLQSQIFANYMFNVMNNGDNCSFYNLRDIILNNKGKSASSDLANFTFNKFSKSIK